MQFWYKKMIFNFGIKKLYLMICSSDDLLKMLQIMQYQNDLFNFLIPEFLHGESTPLSASRRTDFTRWQHSSQSTGRSQ